MSKNTIPTPEHVKMLQSLKTYHYLTAQQLCRLHYSATSIKYVQAQLKLLEDKEHRYVTHVEQYYYQEPYIYILATRGANELRKRGENMRGYFASEYKNLSNISRPHTLLTADVLITASKLPSVLPTITSLTILHDLTLKRLYQGMRPDGWVDITMNNERVPLWIEVDRGTEDWQEGFRKKIRNILTFIKTDYERIYGTPFCTVTFLTHKGENRVNQMVKWTEAELTALGEEKEADLFRFGEICDDPLKLFKTEWCRIPFTTMYSSLL